MTGPRRRIIAAAAAGVAASLLLAGCSTSPTAAAHASTSTPAAHASTSTPAAHANTSTPAAHANTSTVQLTGTSAATSVSRPDRASTAGTPVVSTSTAKPTGATSACVLVTEKEVGTALGANPGPGSPFTSHGSSQCQYGTYQTVFVLVNLTPSSGVAGYDLMHNNPKVGNAGAVTDVAGVGDRAFGISGPNMASIYFNKGDALVLVMVEIHTATSPPMNQALALAKTAANRL